MTQSVTEFTAKVTNKNDIISIDAAYDNIDVPASKGNDVLDFTNVVTNVSDLKFTQESKDLVILYKSNEEDKTVTVKNYFTSNAGNATKSSVKGIKIGEETFNVTDLYQYTGQLSNKKNVITGTAFSDEVTSTEANETFTLKTGNNVINIDLQDYKDTPKEFGNDIVNLTKGENLIINILAEKDASNPNAITADNYAITTNGKDYTITFYKGYNLTEDENGNVVENAGERVGSITLKNFASKDVIGANGSVIVKVNDFEMNLGKELYSISGYEFHNTMVTYDNYFNNSWLKKSVINGTRLSENFNASEYEGVGKYAGKGVTIKAGAGDDVITGSKYNDTITGGTGNNTINIDVSKPFGDDIVNLTKGENLTIKLENYGGDMPVATVDGKDLLVSFGTGEDKKGSLRLKNYAAKDVIGENGSIIVEFAGNKYDLVDQSLMFPNTEFKLPMPILNPTADDVKNGVLNGSRLIENIDLSDYEGTGKYAGKGVKVNAGAGNDVITGSKYSDTITGGTGNNTINIDVSEPFGDDVINLTKGENLEINLRSKNGQLTTNNIGNHYAITTNGKDITYTFYKSFSTLGDTYEENGEVIQNKLGSVTIKGLASKNVVGSNGSVTVNLFDIGADSFRGTEISSIEDAIITYDTYFNDSWEKTGVVNGTRYGELIKVNEYEGTGKKAGKGVTVNAGAGNDVIVGSKYGDTIKAVSGDNIVISGQGNDKLYAGKGNDSFIFSVGDGNDIIYSSNANDVLGFGDVNLEKWIPEFTSKETDLNFTKQGNNLVIGYGEDDSVTLANYFKQKEGTALTQIVNGNKITDITKDVLINTSNGTYLNDNITGTNKADKISTGKGDDIINAGAGNDTITVNGSGTKTIKIGMNDGNDTISMTSKADLKIDFTFVEDGHTLEPEYIKKGNDLIIRNEYEYWENDETKTKEQTTTIKNYFKYGDSLVVNGETITDSDILTYLTGSTKNDKYNIDTLDNDYAINDKGGKDTLNLSNMSKDKLTIFFDVAKDGKTAYNSLMFVNSDNMENGLEIENYFGKGKIETVNVNNEKMNMDAWIDAVKSDVTSWLSNTDYASAEAVLDSDNTSDIQALLGVYSDASAKYLNPSDTPVV